MGTYMRILLGLIAVLAVLAAGCGNAPDQAARDAEPESMSGSIEIDGSSTVAPLTDAISEVYNEEVPEVVVNLGVSGTGGGFERFCSGETDISNASRGI